MTDDPRPRIAPLMLPGDMKVSDWARRDQELHDLHMGIVAWIEQNLRPEAKRYVLEQLSMVLDDLAKVRNLISSAALGTHR